MPAFSTAPFSPPRGKSSKISVRDTRCLIFRRSFNNLRVLNSYGKHMPPIFPSTIHENGSIVQAGVFLARGKVYFNRVCAVRIIKGKTSLSGTQWFRLNDRKRNDFGCSSTTQQLNVNLIARLSKMRRQIGKSNAASNLITVRSGRRVSHNLERSERSSSWH